MGESAQNSSSVTTARARQGGPWLAERLLGALAIGALLALLLVAAVML